MIRKLPSPLPAHLRVIFELPACVWADRVFLVGDFNDWDEQATPFRQNRNGIWRVVLDLPIGKRFEFRYLIDGSWRTDYHADGFSNNLYDSQNSVIDTSAVTDSALAQRQTSLIHEGTGEQHWARTQTDYQPPTRQAA